MSRKTEDQSNDIAKVLYNIAQVTAIECVECGCFVSADQCDSWLLLLLFACLFVIEKLICLKNVFPLYVYFILFCFNFCKCKLTCGSEHYHIV